MRNHEQSNHPRQKQETFPHFINRSIVVVCTLNRHAVYPWGRLESPWLCDHGRVAFRYRPGHRACTEKSKRNPPTRNLLRHNCLRPFPRLGWAGCRNLWYTLCRKLIWCDNLKMWTLQKRRSVCSYGSHASSLFNIFTFVTEFLQGGLTGDQSIFMASSPETQWL